MSGASDVERLLLPGRIVVGALLGSVLLFGAVTVFLVEGGGFQTTPELAGILLLVWLAVAAGALLARGPLRRAAARAARRDGAADPAALAPHFLRDTILAGGLTEGLSLFAGVIYLLSGSRLALAALALGAFLLSGLLPVAARFERFRDEVAWT